MPAHLAGDGRKAFFVRRFKILKITSELFRALLLQDGTYAVKVEGIPPDVQINDAVYDLDRDEYVLRLESESFPEVPDGEETPQLMPTLTAIYRDRIERGVIATWLRQRGYADLSREVLFGYHHEKPSPPQQFTERVAGPSDEPVDVSAVPRRGREFL